MKALFNLIFFLSFFLFSQKKTNTIYIIFDNSIDKHIAKKKGINYFDICIDNNKYIRFQYGIYQKKILNQIKNDVINRKELSKLLKEDNPNKNIRYIIVEKANGKYILYESDHLLRKITD